MNGGSMMWDDGYWQRWKDFKGWDGMGGARDFCCGWEVPHFDGGVMVRELEGYR